MSRQYSGLLEGIDRLIEIIRTKKPGKDLQRELVKIWYGDDYSQEIIYRGGKTTLANMMEQYGPNTINNLINAENNDREKGLFSWIMNDIKIKNFDKRRYIASFAETIYSFLGHINTENKQEDFKYLILNIFYKLTNYNSGAFVHIRELIDTRIVSILQHREGRYSPRQYAVHQDQKLIESLFFTFECMGVQLPAPYYKNLGAFEKTDELSQSLMELERAFEKEDESHKV